MLEPLESRFVLAGVAWDGGGDGTSWHDPLNWDGDVIPDGTDDVTIDVSDSPTISFTTASGEREVNSLVCRETINFEGGKLSLMASASMEGATTLDGGKLAGGAWTFSGQQLLFTSSSGNGLVGPITVNGDLERVGNIGYLRISGGLALNGTLSINGNTTVDFEGTQTFSAGTIHFVADNTAAHTLRVAGPDGSVLTIAADAEITGGSQNVTSNIASTGTGTQALVNLGAVRADNPNAGFQITAESFTNQGTVRALASATLRVNAATWDSSAGSLGADEGTLDIGGSVTAAGLGLPSFFRNAGTVNVAGTIDATGDTMTLNAQTGSFTLNGGEISGGTLTMTDGSQLYFTSSSGNGLVGPITVNGDLERVGNIGYLRISGGLALNGTLSINGNTTVDFEGTQTFSAGTIHFVADNTAAHTLRVAGPDGSVLTIAADAEITGGSQNVTSNIASTGTGTQALVNLGAVRADNPNAGFQITAESFTNQGTVRALASATLRVNAATWDSSAGSLGADEGTLDIGGSVTAAGLGLPSFFRNAGTVNVAGTIDATGDTMTLNAQTGSFTLNGGEISGGTLTMTDGSQLYFTSSSGNGLVGPITVNGDLERVGNIGYLRISGGLALNGTLSINGNTTVDFEGTQTFSAGTIHFVADNTAAHTLRVAGPDGSVLTIAADAEITGGSQNVTSNIASTGTGTQALVNLGAVRADNPNAGFQITAESFTNQGTVRALASATLRVNAATWDSSAGSLGADEGTLDIGGSVTAAGLGLPSFFRNAGTVNVAGTIDATGDTMTLNAQTGSFTLNGGEISGGTLTMTDGSQLYFTSSSGNGLVGPITVNGDLERVGNIGYLRISGGLALNGTLSINGNTTVDFEGTQTFSAGTIHFVADNTAAHTLRVAGPDGSVLTIAADAEITGGSQNVTSNIASTGTGTQALVNLGAVRADNPNAGFQITAESFTNQGTVRALASATLRVNAATWDSSAGSLGADEGTLDIGGSVTAAGLGLPSFFRNAGTVNVAGTIDATGDTMTLNAQTGSFTLNGGEISGGTLTMTDGSQLYFTSSSGNGLVGPITVNGDLERVGNIGYLRISGGLALNGTLSINGNTTVDFEGTQTFSAGTIHFVADNTAAHTLRVAGPDGSVLTIAADAEITGGSQNVTSNIASTGTGTQALVNLGAVRADNPNAGFQITAESFTNQGTVEATGGTLRIDLPGSDATWTNDARINLGPGGRVEVIDNLVLADTSEIHLYAQGGMVSDYGVLSATGTATISGAFTGSYINGYVPTEGTFFDFLTATGGRTGEFTSTSLPTPPAGDKTVLIYEGARVRMLSTDLADLDLNGVTNTQDILLFLNLWTSQDPRADVDGNGVIDTRDVLFFLNLWTDG